MDNFIEISRGNCINRRHIVSYQIVGKELPFICFNMSEGTKLTSDKFKNEEELYDFIDKHGLRG